MAGNVTSEGNDTFGKNLRESEGFVTIAYYLIGSFGIVGNVLHCYSYLSIQFSWYVLERQLYFRFSSFSLTQYLFVMNIVMVFMFLKENDKVYRRL